MEKSASWAHSDPGTGARDTVSTNRVARAGRSVPEQATDQAADRTDQPGVVFFSLVVPVVRCTVRYRCRGALGIGAGQAGRSLRGGTARPTGPAAGAGGAGHGGARGGRAL